MSDVRIEVEGLTKRFGRHQALRGVDLTAGPGQVLAVLGRNGAGKTTTIRVLATLAVPDSGRARVCGFDVVGDPVEVRRRIGVTGQGTALDGALTGRENLVLLGRLLGLAARAAAARAADLLERFGLTDAADRAAATYSGGMQRRLDLAGCLVGDPRVLFLDEPSTGLDPASRQVLWSMIRDQATLGTTVLLTTQYLEEAEQLADQVAVIDGGAVVAAGSPDDLKSMVGTRRLQVTVDGPDRLAGAAAGLRAAGLGPLEVDARSHTLSLGIPHLGVVAEAADVLRRCGVDDCDLAVARPSLDEVFLHLTGEGDAKGRPAQNTMETCA